MRPPFGLISVRNSEAKVPSWISVRTFFISLRVSSVIRRLPVSYTHLTSLTYCVIPYLPGDVIKIALASLLTIQLDKRMPKI